MKFNYIPLQSVIARVYQSVPKERLNPKTLYMWASDAIKNVMVFETLTDSVCFAKVDNFKAKLPREWKLLNQIFYNECAVNQDTDLKVHLVGINLIPDSTIKEEGKHLTVDLETPSEDIITIPVLGEPDGTYIQGTDLVFKRSSRYLQERKGWKPLIESNSNFHDAINCGIDITGECCGKHTYSYKKGCNYITVTFQKGWVAISYKHYAKCDEGFNIPDYESFVPQAIENYLMWKVFEKEAILGVEGSREREMLYKREYGLLMAKAKSEQKMMDIDELENLKNAMVRLTPHNYPYDSGMGNLSDVDNVKFDEIPYKH